MKVDLFSDLDNTLIYSHRVVLEQDKVAVELLNSREQSYMTRRTLAFLQSTPWVRLIPVTTRSKEQFERITLFPGPYALVCNGGELLIHGVSDPQWLAETREIVSQAMYALRHAAALMESMAEQIHIPSGLMVYASFHHPAEAAQKLRAEVDGAVLRVLSDSRKVYCIPTAMHKGAAVSRFKERYQTEYIVTAGDSEFDISLLEAGDLAVTKRSLSGYVHNKNTIAVDDRLVLSDELSAILENLKHS